MAPRAGATVLGRAGRATLELCGMDLALAANMNRSAGSDDCGRGRTHKLFLCCRGLRARVPSSGRRISSGSGGGGCDCDMARGGVSSFSGRAIPPITPPPGRCGSASRVHHHPAAVRPPMSAAAAAHPAIRACLARAPADDADTANGRDDDLRGGGGSGGLLERGGVRPAPSTSTPAPAGSPSTAAATRLPSTAAATGSISTAAAAGST